MNRNPARDGRRSGTSRALSGPSHQVGSSAQGTRQLRVAEEVRHVLAGVFARAEFRDPELADAQITATEVRISPDLKHATVFVSRLGRTDIALLLPALRRAAPYLRGLLAQAMRNQRGVPELHFQADTALDYAMHVDKLLRQPVVVRDLSADQAKD